jgi:hypothetical protein
MNTAGDNNVYYIYKEKGAQCSAASVEILENTPIRD